MSPTAALVWAKHSFMFSVILSWGQAREAGPAQEEDERDRGRGVSGWEREQGSLGVWLPSLPSPEEALENSDNKNSCSQAKRKCHFYPGLVLGMTGATSLMGSRPRGSSGQEASLRSTAWTLSPKDTRNPQEPDKLPKWAGRGLHKSNWARGSGKLK